MNRLREIERRLAETENLRRFHAGAHRSIEAAACEIRAQALREVLAIIGGRPLPPLEAHVRDGERTAEAR